MIMALTLAEFSAQSSQTRICIMVFGSVLPEADFGNTISGSTNETVPRSDGELAEEQAYDLTDKFGQAIARTATMSSGVFANKNYQKAKFFRDMIKYC